MAESLISELVKFALGLLVNEADRLLGVEEEVSTLTQKLKSINVALADAEGRAFQEYLVKLWLDEVKDVAYDIEDVLEHWSIISQMDKPTHDGSSTSQQGNKSVLSKERFRSMSTICCFCLKQAKPRHLIANEIIEINKRLVDINKRKDELKFVLKDSPNQTNENIKHPTTTSYKDVKILPSLEKSKEFLISKLLDDETTNKCIGVTPIISITGFGGIGKTTLAQSIFNDPQMSPQSDNKFSKKIWVCVSDPFDQLKVANSIAKQLDTETSTLPDDDLQIVLNKISNSIKGNKFFLVLDDVWTEKREKLEPILVSLREGSRESRILLTTRNDIVAENMESYIFHVERLSFAESLSLFKHYAFRGKSEEEYQQVEDTAKKLVELCKGVPLAIMLLGGFMRSKHGSNEWRGVLKSDLWKETFDKGIFPSLIFSYIELPSPVKRCFAFCSLFPKDTYMDKDQLIRLWMAQGYLQGSNRMELEDVGKGYIDLLVMRSFFNEVEEYDDPVFLTMHDIIHDFAQQISNKEIAFSNSSTEICNNNDNKKLRHVAFYKPIHSNSNFEHFKYLRTLIVVLQVDSNVDILSELLYLRSLDVRYEHSTADLDIFNSVKNVGKLVHLRYLRIEAHELTTLPEEIFNLHYLQTLDVLRCPLIRKFPIGIRKLANLRHLLYSLRVGLYHREPELVTFNSEQINLEALRNLNDLHGKLKLAKLSQVKNIDDVNNIELHKKRNINHLVLEFGGRPQAIQSVEQVQSIESELLDALRPPKDLEYLAIYEYKGRKPPSWLFSLQFLMEVALNGFGGQFLPPFGNLPSLTKLIVGGANLVEIVGAEFLGLGIIGDHGSKGVAFPKLTYLEFRSMHHWKHWEDQGMDEIMRSSNEVKIMPRLLHLKIEDCAELKCLPRFLELLQKMESLSLFHCDLPVMKLVDDGDYPQRFCIGVTILSQSLKSIRMNYETDWYFRDETHVVPIWAFELSNGDTEEKTMDVVGPKHVNFTYLELNGTGLVQKIPEWVNAMKYLKVIEVYYSLEECLPPFGELLFLEKLKIIRAYKVKQIGDEFYGTNYTRKPEHTSSSSYVSSFPKLEEFSLIDFPDLEEWKDAPSHNLGGVDHISMPSLRHLKIHSCDQLKSFPRDIAPKTLTLKFCNTVNVNVWILHSINRVYIKKIVLRGFQCDTLPTLGSLPSLEYLSIQFCEFSYVGKEFYWTEEDDPLTNHKQREKLSSNSFIAFPSLQYLMFESNEEFEEWRDPLEHLHQLSESHTVGDSNQSDHEFNNIKIMPLLRGLSIYRNDKLKALPRFLLKAHLKKLTLVNMGPTFTTWWEEEEASQSDWYRWKSRIASFVMGWKY